MSNVYRASILSVDDLMYCRTQQRTKNFCLISFSRGCDIAKYKKVLSLVPTAAIFSILKRDA